MTTPTKMLKASGLRPEVSLAGGLATAALVYSIYSRALPTNADLRVAEQGEQDAETARKQAMWASAGVVAAISLLAKDPTIFVVGGAMTIALDWTTRHNIWANPYTHMTSILTREDQSIPTQEAAPDLYGPPLAAV